MLWQPARLRQKATWYHFPIAWDFYWSGDYESALAEAKKLEMPDYWWTHGVLTTFYGAMDRKEEARPSTAKLLELYPEFPRKCREEWRKWNNPEPMIDQMVRDLRRAGLDVPEGT